MMIHFQLGTLRIIWPGIFACESCRHCFSFFLRIQYEKQTFLDQNGQLEFVVLSWVFPGQRDWQEISWKILAIMTLWCCVCWREVISSVLTWWTASKSCAETPTRPFPWGWTSYASRATWWAHLEQT